MDGHLDRGREMTLDTPGMLRWVVISISFVWQRLEMQVRKKFKNMEMALE